MAIFAIIWGGIWQQKTLFHAGNGVFVEIMDIVLATIAIDG
jgi:hypothetical protein